MDDLVTKNTLFVHSLLINALMHLFYDLTGLRWPRHMYCLLENTKWQPYKTMADYFVTVNSKNNGREKSFEERSHYIETWDCNWQGVREDAFYAK